MEKINIRTLAKQLGLSIGTVSKALKDSHEISIETKKRVWELSNKLNYIPNPYASSLRRQKSKTIAVVLPEVADSFFSQAINGIQEVASKKNYHVLIYLSYESMEKEIEILHNCTSRVDGILISVSSETQNSQHIERVKTNGTPLVLFDRVIEDFICPKVITNDYECGAMTARLLIEKGSRNPVFISSSNNLSICHNRALGFNDEIYKHKGFEKKNRMFFINCYGTDEEALNDLKTIIENHPEIDAIVASVEKVATIAYLLFKEKQISIPSDIKIIAFSTMQLASILNPSLSTIFQPAYEMGKMAAQVLFDVIDQKKNFRFENQTFVIPSKLVERESTQAITA